MIADSALIKVLIATPATAPDDRPLLAVASPVLVGVGIASVVDDDMDVDVDDDEVVLGPGEVGFVSKQGRSDFCHRI